jgi:hypothetical protein
MSHHHITTINFKSMLTINLHHASLIRWKTSGYSESSAGVEPNPYASKRLTFKGYTE